MSRNLPDERRKVKELSYKDGFSLRLEILFDDMRDEENLDLKVSHVFDTALNGIFSAAVSAHNVDVHSLTPAMQQSIEKNRISVEEAKELFLQLKKAITKRFGIRSIPVMISLWYERAGHIDRAFDNQIGPWTPFTPMELSVNRKRR